MRFALTFFDLPALRLSLLRLLLAAVSAAAVPAYAFADVNEVPAISNATPALPDAPSASLMTATGYSSSLADADPNANAGAPDWQGATATSKPMALPRVKFIAAGQPAPNQRAQDKIELGLRETVTPFAMLGWVFSAGWTQLIDGSPNYGTNSQAFAQRLGAAAALRASRTVFSDGVLATAFHQDPRYYQLGHDHKFVNRVAYAVTRPIVGRTDGGRTIPNYATILGAGSAAALTQAYYPERNVTPGQVMQTWGTTLGGSALGYLVSEFGGEVIQWLHVEKHE